MIVTPPTIDEATGHAAEMYDSDLASDGLVYAHTQVMAINPDADEAFEQLVRAITPSIGVRLYELATLGAARALASPHCLLGHGSKVLRLGLMDEHQLERLAVDYRDADLTEAEVAVMAYAERLSTDAASMTDADTQTLRDHGFSDRQVVDITLAAAARNYFSRALQALAVPADDVPSLSPRIAEALLSPTR